MYKAKLSLPSFVTFGVEIEFEYAKYSNVEVWLEEWNRRHFRKEENHWIIKEDQTAIQVIVNQCFGGEINSPVLKDKVKTWQHLKEICMMLYDYDAKCTDMTGGHIHFGTQILGNDMENWFHFLQLWCAYEDIINQFAAGESKKIRIPAEEEYAKPVRPEYIGKLKDFSSLRITNFIQFLEIFYLARKSYAIDFSHCYSGNYQQTNTIEIRVPNGTLQPEIWQNNVKFFAHLLLFCRNDKFPTKRIREILYGDEEARTSDLANMIYTKEDDQEAFIKQYRKEFKS